MAAENDKLTIKAAANVSAMAERKLPAGTVAVEASLSASGATGETRGPGLGVIWPGGQKLRVNLRGPENRFGIDSTAAPQKIAGSLPKDSEVTFRIRIEGDALLVESRSEDEDGDRQPLAQFARDQFPGNPASVRLRKTHGVESTDDHTAAGDAGTCISAACGYSFARPLRNLVSAVLRPRPYCEQPI